MHLSFHLVILGCPIRSTFLFHEEEELLDFPVANKVRQNLSYRSSVAETLKEPICELARMGFQAAQYVVMPAESPGGLIGHRDAMLEF